MKNIDIKFHIPSVNIYFDIIRVIGIWICLSNLITEYFKLFL